MTELEARYPCPVCLGVQMVKTPVRPTRRGQSGGVLLDHCERCGGVWFEAGEVQQMRQLRPELLWRAIETCWSGVVSCERLLFLVVGVRRRNRLFGPTNVAARFLVYPRPPDRESRSNSFH